MAAVDGNISCIVPYGTWVVGLETREQALEAGARMGRYSIVVVWGISRWQQLSLRYIERQGINLN